jgi:hypothetical protein
MHMCSNQSNGSSLWRSALPHPWLGLALVAGDVIKSSDRPAAQHDTLLSLPTPSFTLFLSFIDPWRRLPSLHGPQKFPFESALAVAVAVAATTGIILCSLGTCSISHRRLLRLS